MRRWTIQLVFAAAVAGIATPSASLWANPQPEWTLFAPNNSTTTYLIDLNGVVRHLWSSAYRPGQAVYLLDGGRLLRTCNDPAVPGFQSGGRGGRVELLSWTGAVEWTYLLGDVSKCQHHDAIVLPSGNVLAIVWEAKTRAEAIAAGRNPAQVTAAGMWSEMLLEIQPIGTSGGQVVWEWHVWDHLVQNFDAAKPNFAVPSTRPERINLNYPPMSSQADWLHANGLAYNAALDQIVLSVHNFNEIWIISHAPAAAGDLLYRWGNPAAYGTGNAGNQKLYGQHNPQWIADGLAGGGNILIYNNGLNRPQGAYSSVEEIVPPLEGDGTYTLVSGQAYGPAAPVWMCDTAGGVQFYSSNISGAQRLANGNTLVCVGSAGRFIELDSACQNIWEYTSPFTGGVFRATRIDALDPRLEGLLWFRGDANCDGVVDAADLDSFVQALLDPIGYAADHDGDPNPECNVMIADMNASGAVNSEDIRVFINLLLTP